MSTRAAPRGYANAGADVEDGARLSRALQQGFMSTHRITEAQGENAFELDFPGHLRVSRTRNVSEFKKDQTDLGREQAPRRRHESRRADVWSRRCSAS